MQLPQHMSLVKQVVDSLRQGLQRGEWRGHLPPERELCASLEVSRATLRAALVGLQRGRLIRVRHGARTRILARPKASHPHTSAPRIGVLAMEPPGLMSGVSLSFLREMARHLAAAGYEIAVHADSRFGESNPAARLQTLVSENRVACWFLLTSTADVQRWFMNRQIPVLLAGSCHPGIRLPSLDVDYRAVCRHAAQLMANMGHTRAVLVTPRTGLAGDLNSEAGFREVFQDAASPEGVTRVVHHDGSAKDVQSVLAGVFGAGPAPSALLVSQPTHVLTVITHLAQTAIGVPRDVSVISRDDAEYLGHVVPSVARYVFDWDLYVRRLARAVLRLAKAGTIVTRQTLILPEFRNGASLAAIRPPAGPRG